MIALSSVNIGPPKSTACWPVTMATVRGSRSCAAAVSASGGALRFRCCASRICGNRLALPRLLLRARDRTTPRGGIRGIAGKELRDARVVEGVVGRQPANPGEPSNVDGEAHGGDVVPGACTRAHGCRG